MYTHTTFVCSYGDATIIIVILQTKRNTTYKMVAMYTYIAYENMGTASFGGMPTYKPNNYSTDL